MKLLLNVYHLHKEYIELIEHIINDYQTRVLAGASVTGNTSLSPATCKSSRGSHHGEPKR